MKTKTRKNWIKELDKLLHEAVVKRDKVCVKCGRSNHLGVAHFYPKGKYTRLRYDLDNVLLMCWLPCHFGWAHRDIPGFNHWFNEKYPERAKRLEMRANYKYKTKIDYELEKLYLKDFIKK